MLFNSTYNDSFTYVYLLNMEEKRIETILLYFREDTSRTSIATHRAARWLIRVAIQFSYYIFAMDLLSRIAKIC